MIRGAIFSGCRTWRYSLTREWDAGRGKQLMIMLNPSTADDERDDATTIVMVRRAQRDLFRSYEAVNLFALVAIDPKALSRHFHSIGPDNDGAILAAVERADRIIVAWGDNGRLHGRDEEVLRLLGDRELWCFGLTKAGAPRFPRAIRRAAPLELFGATT